MKVIMLTQDNCPKCVVLAEFLEKGLENKYQEEIEVVRRQDNEKEFMALARKHKIMSTPVLIAEEEVLRDTKADKVVEFLEKYIG